ncbi:DUF2345 domain-containing protein, partial [Jeongeupia naejangsanensis]
VIAGEEILLTAGGGYIRLKGGNIEIHCPGKVDVKGADHSFSGPASFTYSLPSWTSTNKNLPCAAAAAKQGSAFVKMK